MSFLFAAQLGRLGVCRAHSRSAISDHQVSVERLFIHNEMAEGGFAVWVALAAK